MNSDYRLLADSIPNLAWIADPNGFVYWYNQRWFDYTGTTLADVQGLGWQSLHDPAILPEVMDRFYASLHTGEPFEMIFPLRGADGVLRPFLTRMRPLKDDHGTILRWFGTNTDISDQLRVTAALRESEQRFRTATEAISGILWTNSADGQMVGEQPGWSAFTGQTYADYQGYGWSKAVHPDDAQPSIASWEAAVRERRLYAFEHRVRRHDGQYRLCSIRALPVFDSSSNILEWVGVHTDITDDRKMHQALVEANEALLMSEQSLRIAVEVTRLGYCRIDPATGALLYCTDIFKANYGRQPHEQFTYKDLFTSIHPDDDLRVRATLRKAITERSIFRSELRVVWPDGSIHWISASGQFVDFEDGRPSQIVGVTLDVTQKHLAETALIQAEKLAAVGRLASSIAHEINNPLESVTNLLYLARSSADLDEIHRTLDTADAELRRVSIIANQTLRFHKQASLPKELTCDDLFATVLSMYEGKLRNSRIAVEKRKRAKRPVKVYEGDIRQVLNNILGNAIDAMPTGGRLLLRSRESHDPHRRARHRPHHRRHRRRHEPPHPRPHLRRLLHHQGHRRHRPRPLDHLRHPATPRWSHQRPQQPEPAPPRHSDDHLPTLQRPPGPAFPRPLEQTHLKAERRQPLRNPSATPRANEAKS